MKKNILFLAIVTAIVLNFTRGLPAQTLPSVSAYGSGTTTSNTFADAGSVAVSIDVTGCNRVLVVATFTSTTNSGSSTGGYRIADGSDHSTNSGEFQLSHSGKDGIGTIVHIFDVSSFSGNRTYVFQHRTDAQTLNSSANLTAIALYDGSNQLTANLQQLTNPISVNSSTWASILNASGFTTPGAGGVYVAASVQNQKTSGGSEEVSAEWVLQYKKSGDTQWKDLNYPIFRSPLGEQKGMVSLVGTLPNNTPAGNYDFRVAHRRVTASSVHEIVTQACNLVVVGLGYPDGFFPVLSGTQPTASTTSTTLVPVIETMITPQTSTDLFIHAQYALRANGTTDPCTHDLLLTKRGIEVSGSIEYLKFIANNQHRCSGSASLLAKSLDQDSVYHLDFRHASRPGRSITTSESYVTMWGLTRSSLPFVAPITVNATQGLLSASYATLKSAFDGINSGLFRGDIIIQVNDNTTEGAACILMASGTGNSSYSSVLIYPTAADLTVSGDIAASLIHLNGATNLTIDGRVNQIGEASLSIINQSINASSRTIRFENSAQHNTLKYLNIKGSSPATTAGVIFFSNASSGTGNSHNLITRCHITNAGERPGNLIYSAGTVSRRNSWNTIADNHLSNFLSVERYSYGINIVSNSENWLMNGNHFFDTEDIAPTEVRGYSCIRINTTDVNNYIITNNHFGGTAPNCGGGRWAVTASTPHFMRVISISTSNTGGTSLISNNTIRGFDYTSTGANPFDGIYVYEGSVLIENNKIGDSTGTESIILRAPNPYLRAIISGGVVQSVDIIGAGSGFTEAPAISFSSGGGSGATATATINGSGEITSVTVTNPGSGYTSEPQVRIQNISQHHSTFHGIWLRGAGNKTIRNNMIGSVKTIGSNAFVFGFEGIYESTGFTGTTEISNNIIGSLGTAHNIQGSSSGELAGIGQRMYGIYSQNQGNSIIQNNVIGNITNNYSGLISASVTIGIYANRGNNSIEGNHVSHITTHTKNSSTASSASVYGIGVNSSAPGQFQAIRNNRVDRISNMNPNAKVDAYGIYFYSHIDDWTEISGNLVQNIEIHSTDITGSVQGLMLYGGKVNLFNNIVHLGKDLTKNCLIYGVWDRGAFQCDMNIYHNTILIEGAVSGTTASSFAYFNSHISNPVVNLNNNLFINTRNGGTGGKHYAVRLGKTLNLSVDYNNYYAPLGVLGWLGVDRTTLAAWQTATAQDINSYNADPVFVGIGTGYAPYEPTVVHAGVTGTGILTDHSGRSRSSVSPKIGALEKYEFVWTGALSSDYNTPGNWIPAEVPGSGADILFDPVPSHHCVLDQARTVGDIVNGSDKNFVLNGRRLTVLGELQFSGIGEIDATSANACLVLEGPVQQTLPAHIFVDNRVDTLIIQNLQQVQLEGYFAVEKNLMVNSGSFLIGANRLVVNGGLSGTGLTGGHTSALVLGGIATLPVSLPQIVLKTLWLDRPDVINLLGDLTITDTLQLISGTLALNGHGLVMQGNHLLSTTGAVDAGAIASRVVFENSAPVTLPSNIFATDIQHLTINTSVGITVSDDLSVSSSLNLLATNPSATKGLLDLGNHVLEMKNGAVTTGVGDVSGRIVRNGLLPEVTYTFGHAKTTIRFYNAGVADMPDQIKFISTIGETHPSKSNTIQRHYEIVRIGGESPTRFTLSLHYLESELNGLTESKLVFWDHHVPYNGISPHEHGKTLLNTAENWISLSGHGIQYLVKNEYQGELAYVDDVTTPQNQSKIWLIAEKESSSDYVWLGAVSSDWDAIANWSGSNIPTSASDIIIPASTPYRAIIPANETREVRSVSIQPGAVLESGVDGVLEVYGALEINSGNPSWENYGIFVPSTGTVIFKNANAAINGTTSFYNLTIPAGQRLSVLNGGVVRVAGVLDNQGVLDIFYDGPTTFEYNGGNQAVTVPENGEYYHLIMSGSGAKSMPPQSLEIKGEFSVSDHASVTSAASLVMHGNMLIGEDAVFATGAFHHVIKGNLEVDGLYNAAGSHAITFSGSTHQSISGDQGITFATVIISNTHGISCQTDVNIAESLVLTDGIVTAGGHRITIQASGSITGGSATAHVSGQLARVYTGTGLKFFPIGKAGVYYPMSLEYTSLTGTSTVTAECYSGGFPGTEPPGIGLVGTQYWNINQTGGSSFTYDLTLDGSGLVFQDDPLILQHDGTQTTPHLAVATLPAYTATGLTTLSDFAFGESTCQPPLVTMHPSTGTQVVCLNGVADELSVSAIGDGLSFQWYENTANTAVGGVAVGVDASTFTPSASQAGTWYYYVVVTGDCGVTTSTVSGAITVNSLPTFTYTTSDISCFNGSDGVITISASGGSGSGYEYRIHNGTAWIGWQSGNTFSALPAGNYTLEIRDGNGCVQVNGQQ